MSEEHIPLPEGWLDPQFRGGEAPELDPVSSAYPVLIPPGGPGGGPGMKPAGVVGMVQAGEMAASDIVSVMGTGSRELTRSGQSESNVIEPPRAPALAGAESAEEAWMAFLNRWPSLPHTQSSGFVVAGIAPSLGPFDQGEERRKWRLGGNTSHLPTPEIGDRSKDTVAKIDTPRRAGGQITDRDLVKIDLPDWWWRRFFDAQAENTFIPWWDYEAPTSILTHRFEMTIRRYNRNVDRIWEMRRRLMKAHDDWVLPRSSEANYLGAWIATAVGQMANATIGLRAVLMNPKMSEERMDQALSSAEEYLDAKSRGLDLIQDTLDRRYAEAAWQKKYGKKK